MKLSIAEIEQWSEPGFMQLGTRYLVNFENDHTEMDRNIQAANKDKSNANAGNNADGSNRTDEYGEDIVDAEARTYYTFRDKPTRSRWIGNTIIDPRASCSTACRTTVQSTGLQDPTSTDFESMDDAGGRPSVSSVPKPGDEIDADTGNMVQVAEREPSVLMRILTFDMLGLCKPARTA